ncbi:hypothetical protein EYC80_007230 [Monilinia laxa]|uniref:Uncharacterized protein n=1 Tax=Monilinia laxa TaxID=61186 RepID=A0A5N6K0L2_MONLA|nr:hypothetical protein EYC80_007230 [Monilinia laxa]
MSTDQLTTILRMQDLFVRQYRARNFALFFQYDYAESQQAFVRKYPTAILRGLAVLKGWEWFIDENSLPNIRLCFYDQNLHIPTGPAILPATNLEQCQKVEPSGVMGYVYVMSHYDMFCLQHEQAAKGRQQYYHTITFQSKSINGTIAKTCQLAGMFFDITNTLDGSLNLEDPFVNLYWRTGIKRMQQTGIMAWYVYRTWLKVKGVGMSFEPLFVVPNENAVTDPRATRKQQSASSSARLKQLQQQQPQQASKPKKPEIKLSQQQREAILQQIFCQGSIPKGQQSKLTERQKSLMILNYLQHRQAHAPSQQEKSSKKNQHTRVPGEKHEEKLRDAILNDVIRKQQQDMRRPAEQTPRSNMPPPPPPAHRLSHSAQIGNGRPSSAQLNYAQNSNPLKRPAPDSSPNPYPTSHLHRVPSANSNSNSNSMPSPNSTAHSTGAPDPKRQKLASTPELKRPASDPNVDLSGAPEAKRKYVGRGRPRKGPVTLPIAGSGSGSGNGNQNHNQNQASGIKNVYGRGKGAVGVNDMGTNDTNSNGMNTNGKPPAGHINPEMRGASYSGTKGYNQIGGNSVGNVRASGNGDGSGNGHMRPHNTVDRTQAFPHVEAAARMVDYFQDKVGVDMAGDGRMQ